MYRAIIIDDELMGINTLKVLIEKHAPTIRLVATATEPENGIKLIEDYRPDIVFLDISMPKMNGFELLEKLAYKNFKLVFTTAHEEYAIKAIKNKAQDYLLKPIDIDELKNCLSNIAKEKENNESINTEKISLIELSLKDEIIFIKPEDIIRLEASGSYTLFYTVSPKKYIASKILKEYESKLNPFYFFRCHSSHLINLKYVVRVVTTNGFFAEMKDGSMVEIARKNKQLLIEKLKML